MFCDGWVVVGAAKERDVSFQDLKSMMIGVVLVFGVMLAGPLTTQASPSNQSYRLNIAKPSDATVRAKPRAVMVERFGSMLGAPKLKSGPLDMTTSSAQDFGDWEPDSIR
jgi:hypothetical protein